MAYPMKLMRVGLAMLPLMLAPALRAEAAGLAGPNQTIAEGLVVLLGDPATSGTDPAGNTYHWRQVIMGSEPYVKLSHLDAPNTMFIAPGVSSNTLFRFGVTKNGSAEETVDITVIKLPPDDPTNTTFIDGTISGDCSTYDPATRACGAGAYLAMKSTFRTTFNPVPSPGRRYVWREGTYSYSLNRTSCWANTTPVVRIEGPNAANGTPTAPIQFKAYKKGSNYETVTIDMGGTTCVVNMLFWVAGSSYVVVEGFTLTGNTGTGNQGRTLVLGGSGWAGGAVNFRAAPVHHATVRHVVIHDTGSSGLYRGAFSVPGPSHEVGLQYVTAHHGSAGIELGVPHETDKTLLPYNVFIHTALVYDNHWHTGNSSGIYFGGTRNSAVYRAVSYRNSDAGFNTQGPHMDTNTWWDVVSFGQDGALAPTTGGNERGHQIGTINAALATNPPYLRAAAYNRVYRFIAYDNKGNGINDVGGSVDGRYYNLTVFNNCLHAWGGSWAGIGLESHAGDGAYPGSPAPGATVTNSIVFHQTTCNNLLVASGRGPYTTLVTNSTSSPGFVVATPADGSASGLTTDTTMYSNAAQRILNPNFGAVSGLALQAGSAAIDAGTWVSGVHCDRADDDPNPYPVNDPNCLHWKGAAPDLGAYEYGVAVAPPSPPAAPSGLQIL